MDVWVNFTNATKWQAEGIFKCFFPAARPAASPAASTADLSEKDTSQKNLPGSKRRAQLAPMLNEDEISDLAKRFADAIPEDELSVAALQGYLLKNKTRPRECVDEVAAWYVLLSLSLPEPSSGWPWQFNHRTDTRPPRARAG